MVGQKERERQVVSLHHEAESIGAFANTVELLGLAGTATTSTAATAAL